MESSKKASRVIIYAAIGIGAFVIVAVILFSGFSIDRLPERAFTPSGPGLAPTRTTVVPPEVVLINNSARYEGDLLGYTVSRRFQSFQELPDISVGNITAISTDNIVSVDQRSQIQYAIEGDMPSGSQFDSLSVVAYTEDGMPVGILDLLSNNSIGTQVHSFSVDELEPGRQYILLSTATWLDYRDSPAITGYVYYGHRINVVP